MMMRLFRALMPREARFVEHFAAHSEQMVAASIALQEMMHSPLGERSARFKEVCRIEGEADLITRETLFALHRAFITPFDRSDIHTLITALDDAVDLIEEVAQHAVLYRIEHFTPRMHELAALIEKSARLVAEAIPLLHNVNRNAMRINNLCDQVGAIESDADKVLRLALSELIAEAPEPIAFIGLKELYDLLETATDRLDDVANVIEGVVLDQV